MRLVLENMKAGEQIRAGEISKRLCNSGRKVSITLANDALKRMADKGLVKRMEFSPHRIAYQKF